MEKRGWEQVRRLHRIISLGISGIVLGECANVGEIDFLGGVYMYTSPEIFGILLLKICNETREMSNTGKLVNL